MFCHQSGIFIFDTKGDLKLKNWTNLKFLLFLGLLKKIITIKMIKGFKHNLKRHFTSRVGGEGWGGGRFTLVPR